MKIDYSPYFCDSDFNLGKEVNSECRKNDWERILLDMCFWVDIDVDWQNPQNVVVSDNNIQIVE